MSAVSIERILLAAVAAFMLAVPWLIPALLSPVHSDPRAVSAFAARADTPFGRIGSLLMLMTLAVNLTADLPHTAEEVEAAKSGYLQSLQVSRAQDNELAGRLNNYLFIGRTLAWDADLEAKLKALTPEQINAAMRRHIDPSRLTIIKAGDFAKNPPVK